MDFEECVSALRQAQEALNDAVQSMADNEPEGVLEALQDVVYQANRAIVGIAKSVLTAE